MTSSNAICPGCDSIPIDPLVEHHWGSNYHKLARTAGKIKLICRHCNSVLSVLFDEYPDSWETQERYLKAYNSGKPLTMRFIALSSTPPWEKIIETISYRRARNIAKKAFKERVVARSPLFLSDISIRWIEV